MKTSFSGLGKIEGERLQFPVCLFIYDLLFGPQPAMLRDYSWLYFILGFTGLLLGSLLAVITLSSAQENLGLLTRQVTFPTMLSF